MKIAEIEAIPLTMPIAPGEHRTWWGDYPTVSIVLVRMTTDDGIVGWGEGLARYQPQAYADIITGLLKPKYLGANPFEAARLWAGAFRAMSGKSGGILMECLAAVDIATWDVMGKAAGQPIHRLLGGMGRKRVEAYASSISWNHEEMAKKQIAAGLAQKYRMLKVKLGGTADESIAYARWVRDLVPAEVRLCADANFLFDLDDAIRVARGLKELDFYWFEEPIAPEDIDGYRRLRTAVPEMRFAAGESDHTCAGSRELLASRAVGVFQPDCSRAAGITETVRMAHVAYAFNVAYAPHIGGGGAVSAAANLQLSAALPNFLTYESMIFKSPLREELATTRVGLVDPADGMVPVPEGPGLGIEINLATLEKYRTR